MRAIAAVALSVLLAGCLAAGSTGEPGDDQSAVTTTAPATSAPSVSPAAAVPTGRIAFQRGGDDPGIYTIDPDGSHRTLVIAGQYGTPKWSPDRSTLAIYAEKPDGSVVPALVRPDGSGYREFVLQPHLNCGLAVWTPDGATLALECWDEQDASRTGIYLISAAGTGLHQVTAGHGLPGEFSADGRRLLYTRDVGTDVVQGDVRILDIADRQDRLVSDLDVGQMPGFLPGETAIYAVVGGVIDILRLDGRVLRRVEAPERHIVEARLSPDGLTFAFIYDPQAVPCPGLYRMAADGSDLATLMQCQTAGSPAEHPDWAP